jgi:beta-alanine--pyruvate transaminase
MFRITGDTIALSPPLIITEDQIGEIFEKIKKIIGQIH